MSIPKIMKAVVKKDVNTVKVERVPVPQPGPGEVLVKINTGGVCASDLHLVREAFAYLQMRSGVRIAGHEGCGVVAACELTALAERDSLS